MFGEETIEFSLAEEKHWIDKVPYLKDEKYPLLFLSFVVKHEDYLRVSFKKPVKVEHTAAGLRCQIVYPYGLLLEP